MKDLVLGIIGGSTGNGHPFSWSAIFNGYNSREMALSGYPVITKYLQRETWPEVRLKNATVDYVYTPDRHLSSKISSASHIKNIMTTPDDMVQRVDALLLARDDAENHLHFAKNFLRAGLPVFIDKPIALSTVGLQKLLSLQQYDGQIFSCSAFSHAAELKIGNCSFNRIAKINRIIAKTPNSWERYGVHIVEPLISYLYGFHCLKVTKSPQLNKGNLLISFTNDEGVEITLKSLGEGATESMSFHFFGADGKIVIRPTDYFNYFKNSLARFVENIRKPEKIWETSIEHHKKVVSVLELGI